MKTPKLEADIQYRVIEVDQSIGAGDWSKEDEDTLKTLKGQLGYLALLKKLKIHKAFMDSALRTAAIENVPSLQAWCQCLRWVEGLVKENVEKRLEKPRSPYALEEESFAEIAQALKMVGGQ